jgi:hypothetical protein
MSAPEFDGQPMTKREVLIARRYYEDGVVRGHACEFRGYPGAGLVDLRTDIAKRLPLPKVTRPRVVTYVGPKPHHVFRYRVIDGRLEWATEHAEDWTTYGAIQTDVQDAAFLARIAGLFSSPTEEVDDA